MYWLAVGLLGLTVWPPGWLASCLMLAGWLGWLASCPVPAG
jgi:hypothetical protein